MYKLVQKAEKYKQLGFYDKELAIYKKIHNEFYPNSSSLFKRPAILYEKRGEYEKALDLCKSAIELINQDKISGTTSSFDKMIVILERKLNNKPKKEETKNKTNKRFVNTGFAITLLIILSLVYYLNAKENSYDDIQIDMSEMTSLNEISNESDSNEPPKYPITNEMIKKARAGINLENEVIDSAILKTNSSIGLGILVKTGTSYSSSKELCNKFVDELGKVSANEYNFISNKKIYDYYSIYITVGTSNKKEDIILKAFKIKGAKNIKYK